MAADKEAICNMALAHLGVLETVTDMDEDRTKEAKACRIFYDQARKEVLGDSMWPFAHRIDSLTLDAEQPNDEWDYQYEYPSTALKLLRGFSGIRPVTDATEFPYRIISDGTQRYLLTDQADASFEYIEDVTDTERFTPDFDQLLALKLAAYIAPSVTGGDQFKLGQRALELYRIQLSIARANYANQERTTLPAESEFITTRG